MEDAATLAMDQPAGLQVDYVFRGVEHAVRVMVSGQVLELEVEDRMTADQWRGEFDAGFIEDLTHKTGNFKQFNIFCHMLESALTQSSESVTLDLLTYTDLESLRNRKMGGRPGSLAPRSAQLSSKRYLILIYSVEFDRIHYPLPLPYQGKPDPVVLQGIIRSLKEELGRLQGLEGQNTRDTRENEIWHLREQVSRLASEKRELEAQLGRSREEALAGRAARQEAEALRGLVRGLELELRQERGLGHRVAGRRGQDCRRLAKEPGPPRPSPLPAARGGEGIGAEPARPAEDADQRAGIVQEREADSAGAAAPDAGGPGLIVPGALHVARPRRRALLIPGERPREPGSGPPCAPLALAHRWSRAPLRPHGLCESQGKEAERDPDEAAAAEPLRQWGKRGRSVRLLVSPDPAPCCLDWPTGRP
ncbi:centrosomal protein CCDC61 isoform X6 [Gorilla gorilla gorilla]|uniref:centrosomal protein CCDC61 isoform X6 n=1 Tax=Gorilla gorilla gorilla TaxID=9595 RepID=UPI002446496E|nr:centrosomal protein CCDC61 isoform X5 [Gorilla gorilla gorilla]